MPASGSADDPLVQQLLDTFERKDPMPPFYSPEYAALMLTAVPISEVVDSVRKLYLGRVSKAIQDLRATHSADWNPDHWVVVAPPALFHGWERIDGLRVWHTSPFPWSVFLARSPEWFDEQWSVAPIQFGAILPPPVPPGPPTPYVRITDLS